MADQTYSFEVMGYGNMAQLESSIARAQERVAQAVTGIQNNFTKISKLKEMTIRVDVRDNFAAATNNIQKYQAQIRSAQAEVRSLYSQINAIKPVYFEPTGMGSSALTGGITSNINQINALKATYAKAAAEINEIEAWSADALLKSSGTIQGIYQDRMTRRQAQINKEIEMERERVARLEALAAKELTLPNENRYIERRTARGADQTPGTSTQYGVAPGASYTTLQPTARMIDTTATAQNKYIASVLGEEKAQVDRITDAYMRKYTPAIGSASSASRKLASDLEETNTVGNKLNQTFGRIYRTMAAFAAITAVIEVARGLHAIIGASLEYNETIETSRVGIAALLAAQGQFVNANNEAVSGVDKFNASMKLSDDIINKLQYDNLKTAATFEQLVKAFQSALAPGTAAGFSIDQIRKYNLAMVQTASAMGLPLDMLAEELRSMLRGTITPRNTIIATNLGITNEQIRSYKSDAQGLFNFIMGKLEEFNKYGDVIQNTFAGMKSNLLDVFKRAAGEGGKPFFEFLKSEMNTLINFFAVIDEHSGTMVIRPEAIHFMQNFFMEVQVITGALISMGKAFAVIISALGEFDRAFSSAWKVVGDKLDEQKEKAKFISQGLKELRVETDKMMYMEDTNLGIAPSWSTRQLTRSEALGLENPPEIGTVGLAQATADAQKYIAVLQEIKRMTPGALRWSDDAGEWQTRVQAMVFYKGALFDTNQEIKKYTQELMDSGNATHEASRLAMLMANSLNNVQFSAYGAAKSFKELNDEIAKTSGFNLVNAERDIDKKLAGLKAELDAAKSGAPNYALSSERQFAEGMEKVSEAQRVMREIPNEALKNPATMKFWQEYAIGTEEYKDKLGQVKDLENQIGSIKEGRKGGGGGGPKIFETQTREIEKIIEDSNKRIYDLQSDYWMDMLKFSGDYYNAEQINIQKWEVDTRHGFEQTWMDLYTKAEVLTKRVEMARGSKQGIEEGTDEAVAQAWADLKKLTEAYGSLNPLIQAYVVQKNLENEANNKLTPYEDIAKLAEEYAKLTNNVKEQVYWETYLNSMQAEKARRLAPTEGDWIPEEQRQINMQKQRLITLTEQEKNRRSTITKGDDFWAGMKLSAEDYINTLPKLGQMGSQVFDQLTSSIDDAATAWADFCSTGKANFGDFARSVINSLLQMTIKMLLMRAVGSFLGLLGGEKSGVGLGANSLIGTGASAIGWSFSGGYGTPAEKRAGGGPVSAGKRYLVGEQGPELFTPWTGGNIAANTSIRWDEANKQALEFENYLSSLNAEGKIQASISDAVMGAKRFVSEITETIGDASNWISSKSMGASDFKSDILSPEVSSLVRQAFEQGKINSYSEFERTGPNSAFPYGQYNALTKGISVASGQYANPDATALHELTHAYDMPTRSLGDKFQEKFFTSYEDMPSEILARGNEDVDLFKNYLASLNTSTSIATANFDAVNKASTDLSASMQNTSKMSDSFTQTMFGSIMSLSSLFSGNASGGDIFKTIAGTMLNIGMGIAGAGGGGTWDAALGTMVPVSSIPRHHDGLLSDEHLAVIQKGESILPKGSIGGNSNVNTSINVTVNNTGGGATNPKDMEMLGKKVAAAVKEEFNRNLRDNLRPGNMLNRGLR